MCWNWKVLAMLAALLCCNIAVKAQTLFEVKPIGTLGGIGGTLPLGINNNSQIVGQSYLAAAR